ncbi:hypothetical protein [Lacihabitans sp. CCS-44]|uniref:hypothetical protein n=1 Tax=Lacihabitans sp. CCS-44 TaxID=2487331 RepID=UPI0020CCF66D|nr:hypothetical protein [Lacihabitans sp. CCS-44]
MRIKVVLLFLFIPMANFAQQILVDRGVRVGGLWCFPLISDSLSYLYLPTNAHLSLDESKNPQFSFLRYVINKPKSGNNAVSDADGGGILNFLVQYDTPENLVKTAQGILRERLKSEDITIKGPLVFDKGRYTLISSIIKSDTSKPTRKVLTTGEAPVLEGSRIALTFDLKPEASKLLLESFKMATPDVSLVFELGFSGLTDSYDAEMTVDWSEVKKSEAFKASGSVYIVSADVELGFDKLKRDGAIKLKSNGSDQQMEALVQTVYDKLLTLMFKPVKPETVPPDQQGGLMDALLGPNGILGSKNTLGFGLNVGFQMKDLQSEGKTNLYFKGRSTVNRTHFVTFNIGNLYNEYGKDEKYFKDIPMYDPTFQQREVLVGVDGDLEKEFTKMVNSVTVILDKKHQDGRETLHSVIITKKSQDSLKVSKKPLAMVYGFQKDTNRVEWLKYKYKTIWQFQGGGNLEMDWKTESSAMINLYTPFIRKTIMLEGDAKAINAKNIRAISVQIEYPFFGQKKQQRVTLKTSESLIDKKFEITLPNNVEEVDYSITWFGNDGSQKNVKGKDKYGLIFLDEMPN